MADPFHSAYTLHPCLCQNALVHQNLVFLVHDLPQLYRKPPATDLLNALELLTVNVSTFSSNRTRVPKTPRVQEDGVARYLTGIIASSLNWIDDEEQRDRIWESASAQLSQRSGRNAMPSITREFEVNDEANISLHEPSLTEDNLGLKTWASSLLLSRQLHVLRRYICPTPHRVLELGSGTGLVGIAAACLWGMPVTLTDLPEIVNNLERNLKLNHDLVQKYHGSVEARTLNWADTSDTPTSVEHQYLTILAADPIYSPEHPRLLVDTVQRWLRRVPQARFIVELPLRDRYEQERSDLRQLLQSASMELVDQGTEIGFDDWQTNDGNPAQVECWWSIWKPAMGNVQFNN